MNFTLWLLHPLLLYNAVRFYELKIPINELEFSHCMFLSILLCLLLLFSSYSFPSVSHIILYITKLNVLKKNCLLSLSLSLQLSLLHPSLMRIGGRIRTLSREALFQVIDCHPPYTQHGVITNTWLNIWKLKMKVCQCSISKLFFELILRINLQYPACESY